MTEKIDETELEKEEKRKKIARMKDFGPVHKMLEDMIKSCKNRKHMPLIGPPVYGGPDWIKTKEVLDMERLE